MIYTKDYYRILGLEPPTSVSHSSSKLSPEEVRKAYRNALLSAHPDKAKASDDNVKHKSADEKGVQTMYTVDDVKEAFAVLGDGERRAEYNRWVVGRAGETSVKGDFVLGLEGLDLEDFECTVRTSMEEDTQGLANGDGNGEEGGEGGKVEWTRACRCGAEKGFRITEEQLEEAEQRGEKEVLVGCEGCSLWVRVGFDVDEG